MGIIVRGSTQDIDFVQRICRDKVRRGMITITPATGPVLDDVVELRKERDESRRLLKEREVRIAELEGRIAELEGPVAGASVISDEETADDKNIDFVVDSQEVYSGDDKNIVVEDSKGISVSSANESVAAPKRKRRSKKTE